MAIVISIEYPGLRGVHKGHYYLTADEITHVKLPNGMVGLNLRPERGGKRASFRMTAEEARMLAAMLIEGADRVDQETLK